MNVNEPEPIKEYYIVYFDIMGYKAFLAENAEKESVLLKTIHSIIAKTENTIRDVNNSEVLSLIGDLHIQTKVFSDNVLLCVEAHEESAQEQLRIIAFMGLIAEIQRKIVIEYGVFLRGGFTKGRMSISDEYVFGEGLVEAVKMEETTCYPRIAVSQRIVSALENMKKTDLRDGANINPQKLVEYFAGELIYTCDDGAKALSYLYCFDIRSFVPEPILLQMIDIIKDEYPNDYKLFPKSFPDIEAYLASHKRIVEQKLVLYSNYTSFKVSQVEKFEEQEHILKKYVWAMVYHNYMCDKYNKNECFINTQGNCERRHMKLVIHVLGQNGELINR